MYIKESELRALVREVCADLSEDAQSLKQQQQVAMTVANFLNTKHGEALGFMETDDIKRTILSAVLDQMKNSKIQGNEIAAKIFHMVVGALKDQGILKAGRAKPSDPPAEARPEPTKKAPTVSPARGSSLRQRNLRRLMGR